jgi:hypothetical protein
MNGVLYEQIAPEILQAIFAKATARGLSVNDYLRNLLGLNTDSAPSDLTDTEIEVMATVGGFLNDHLPDRFCAGRLLCQQNVNPRHRRGAGRLNGVVP